MNVIILMSTSADELRALQNGKDAHSLEKPLQSERERQTERIKTGYDIRFFVEGDIEERGSICTRRVRNVEKTDTAITFNLEPLA